MARSHARGVVDGIADGARDGTDAGLAEALVAVEPARLEALDEDLRYILGKFHDGRDRERQERDAVVHLAREFLVIGNRVGGDLEALHEGAFHVADGMNGLMTLPVSWL